MSWLRRSRVWNDANIQRNIEQISRRLGLYHAPFDSIALPKLNPTLPTSGQQKPLHRMENPTGLQGGAPAVARF